MRNLEIDGLADLERRIWTGTAAIVLPVFSPSRFVRNGSAYRIAIRYGWVLILARWLYASVVFQFRDYHGRWAPFVAPPFGLAWMCTPGYSASLPFRLVYR